MKLFQISNFFINDIKILAENLKQKLIEKSKIYAGEVGSKGDSFC
jgi:hypothetical protein